MLNFLHLSDLHIDTENAGGQLDRDERIRAALMSDLRLGEFGPFDGILVTGDIARHGRAKEFERANGWLEEVRTATGSSPEALFVVPGNHDVNRDIVRPESSLWVLHERLREPKAAEARKRSLATLLQDPTQDFLAALEEYNTFASEFDCPTTRAEMAWVQTLSSDRLLDDGTAVRIHGLNSALISDGNDAKGNLYLSEFQFHHLDEDSGYVNIALCHHPPSHLIDEGEVQDYFRARTQVVLTGHEHIGRHELVGGVLRVSAGAVHPDRAEAGWKPCYHVLRMSVRNAEVRELLVEVETREWSEETLRFGPHLEPNGNTRRGYVIGLSPRKAVAPSPPSSAPGWSRQPEGPDLAPSTLREAMATATNLDEYRAARRKMIVHFFRLAPIQRFQAAIAAGVWEDGDDNLPAQTRWPRVFERAEKAQRLAQLWNEVAREDATLAGQTNPFEGYQR